MMKFSTLVSFSSQRRQGLSETEVKQVFQARERKKRGPEWELAEKEPEVFWK